MNELISLLHLLRINVLAQKLGYCTGCISNICILGDEVQKIKGTLSDPQNFLSFVTDSLIHYPINFSRKKLRNMYHISMTLHISSIILHNSHNSNS